MRRRGKKLSEDFSILDVVIGSNWPKMDLLDGKLLKARLYELQKTYLHQNNHETNRILD